MGGQGSQHCLICRNVRKNSLLAPMWPLTLALQRGKNLFCVSVNPEYMLVTPQTHLEDQRQDSSIFKSAHVLSHAAIDPRPHVPQALQTAPLFLPLVLAPLLPLFFLFLFFSFLSFLYLDSQDSFSYFSSSFLVATQFLFICHCLQRRDSLLCLPSPSPLLETGSLPLCTLWTSRNSPVSTSHSFTEAMRLRMHLLQSDIYGFVH